MSATYLCLCYRTGKFVTIETRHWPQDRMLMHLIFTSPVSFPVNNNDRWAWGDAHVNYFLSAMAFITYILLAGMALGIQKRSAPLPRLFPWLTVVFQVNSCVCCVHRFSPEVLGLCASTALVWIIIEVLVMLLCLYLLTVHSDLSTFDLIAYSGYKYVG